MSRVGVLVSVVRARLCIEECLEQVKRVAKRAKEEEVEKRERLEKEKELQLQRERKKEQMKKLEEEKRARKA